MQTLLALSAALWLTAAVARPTPSSSAPANPITSVFNNAIKIHEFDTVPEKLASHDGTGGGQCTLLLYEMAADPAGNKGDKTGPKFKVNLYGPDGKQFHRETELRHAEWDESKMIAKKGPMTQDLHIQFPREYMVEDEVRKGTYHKNTWGLHGPSKYQDWFIEFHYPGMTWFTDHPTSNDPNEGDPYYISSGWAQLPAHDAPTRIIKSGWTCVLSAD